MKAVIYNASAGSGKTYQLAYKFVRDVVEQPHLYNSILALSFTNKATEQMKQRILAQLNRLAAGGHSDYLNPLMKELNMTQQQVRQNALRARTLILHDYSRFTVLTLDTFFQRIVRAFIQELGVDIGYTLEIESSTIINQGIDALIAKCLDDEDLKRWLLEIAKERVNQNQKWDIREEIITLAKNLFDPQCLVAIDASMGRDELKQFIAQRVEHADSVIAQLRALGSEGVKIIADAGLSHLDFKGKSTSFVKVFTTFANINNKSVPQITDTVKKKSSDIKDWCDKSSPAVALVPALYSILQQIIELRRDSIIEINTTNLLRQNYRSFALLADLYKTTLDICDKQNTMLLNQTSSILKEFICETDAPFIYEKVGNRYTHFMIDEFQDTSSKEWENMRPLLLNAIAESETDHCNILIVGDIKQSIYRWRGGDWRLLYSQAQRDLGHHNTNVITLRSNYRSNANIVRFNNAIMEGVVQHQNSELNGAIEVAAEQGYIPKVLSNELLGVLQKAYSEHEQIPMQRAENGESEGFVEIVTHLEKQPPFITRICDAIDRGYSPSDILILTRSNTQATEVARELLAFKQSIQQDDEKRIKYNFNVMTQEALTVGYAPVSSFIIAVMRLALNPDDRLQRAIYNQYLSRAYVDDDIPAEELDLLLQLRLYSPIEAFERICMSYELDSNPANIAYMQAIHEQIINFSNNKIADIQLYLEWWDAKGRDKSLIVERSANAIEVMTIHKAKGLERKVVIIPYAAMGLEPQNSGRAKTTLWACEEDNESHIFPIDYQDMMAESTFAADYYREKVYAHLDSVNLFYVAITRAAESLHIFVKSTQLKSGARSYPKLGKVIMAVLNDLTIPITTVEQEEGVVSHQYGVKTGNIKDEELGGSYLMHQYSSHNSKLLLSMPTSKYRERSDGDYSPRMMGLLLHKAFEQAVTIDDIKSNIEHMAAAGEIVEAQKNSLLESIQIALADQRVSEWFSTKWDSVRCECSIIRPGQDGKSRRPDRVMIAGDRVVVVDYKFGEKRSYQHHKQMKLYLQLLTQMGYKTCEGYLWYPRSGEIFPCGE